jgi:hypothetical protein
MGLTALIFSSTTFGSGPNFESSIYSSSGHSDAIRPRCPIDVIPCSCTVCENAFLNISLPRRADDIPRRPNPLLDLIAQDSRL